MKTHNFVAFGGGVRTWAKLDHLIFQTQRTREAFPSAFCCGGWLPLYPVFSSVCFLLFLQPHSFSFRLVNPGILNLEVREPVTPKVLFSFFLSFFVFS